MASLHRPGDAVLTVRQNNETRLIEITAINPVAEKTLGYSARELQGAPLQNLLPTKIVNTLKDYVEFGDGENDLAAVLGRVRNFSIKKRDGQLEPFKLKIIRSNAQDKHSWFELVMRDETSQRREEAVRAALQENFKGHTALDNITGMPDQASLKKDIELMLHHIGSRQLDACFAMMEIDHYSDMLAKLGRVACNKILKDMAILCKQKLRADDVVGATSYQALGIILMDVTPKVAHMVLNRLRWAMASHEFMVNEKTRVNITVSVSFCPLGSGKKDTLLECQQVLEKIRARGGNAVQEVGA